VENQKRSAFMVAFLVFHIDVNAFTGGYWCFSHLRKNMKKYKDQL
jgi:hypothetical protein